jgi:hypothetical protein
VDVGANVFQLNCLDCPFDDFTVQGAQAAEAIADRHIVSARIAGDESAAGLRDGDIRLRDLLGRRGLQVEMARATAVRGGRRER